MNDILVGGDTIDLLVDVNGCRVFAAVFRFCGFLHLFCAWRMFLSFGCRATGLWKNVSPEGSWWLMMNEGRVGFGTACFRQHLRIAFERNVSPLLAHAD